MPTSPLASRVIRVFVSSTFADMQEERNLLVTRVFPLLRERCRQRHVELVEIDLRWGITDEQAKEGRVLPICFAEIERCRPFFVGMLGERYGHVPDQVDATLVEEHPWLSEHADRSITELEMVLGVLRNPAMAKRAFFYFRSPEYAPVEELLSTAADSPQDQRKLADLKERIRHSGSPVRENYSDPVALAEMIEADLWEAIDTEFPEESVVSPEARTELQHEQFAASRCRIYFDTAGRIDELAELVARSPRTPIVVTGEPGSGKSALVSNWLNRVRKEGHDPFSFAHFLGRADNSTSHYTMIARLMRSLEAAGLVPGPVPSDTAGLLVQFGQWLAQAAERRPLLLVLDGLEQMQDRGNAFDLTWLPEALPSDVSVVIVAQHGRVLDQAQARGWPILRVEPLALVERNRLLTEYLGLFRKTLAPDAAERIINAPQSANPLFLKTLLDELRVIGRHEDLLEQVRHYLSAQSLRELYHLALERLENEYKGDATYYTSEYFARMVLSLLRLSRRGLTEPELIDILAVEGLGRNILTRAIRESKIKTFPRRALSALVVSLGEKLIDQDGVLGLADPLFRSAIEERYASAAEDEILRDRIVNSLVADRVPSERAAEEAPWQLFHAERWDRLHWLLSYLEYFFMLRRSDLYELQRYWQALENHGYDLAKTYEAAAEKFEQLPDVVPRIKVGVLTDLGDFARSCAKFDAASGFYERALKMNGAVDLDEAERSLLLNRLGLASLEAGRLDDAEARFREALELRSEYFGANSKEAAESRANLASISIQRGNLQAAEQLRTAAPRSADDPVSEALNLSQQSNLFRARGELRRAAELSRKAREIFSTVYGRNHPHYAAETQNLAVLLAEQGSLDEAEALHLEALAVARQIFGPNHPAVATILNTLGSLMRDRGNEPEAEKYFRMALEIREKALGPEHPDVATTLNNLGLSYRHRGDFEQALSVHRRALAIQEKQLGPESLSVAHSLHNIALSLVNTGDLAGAEDHLLRALRLKIAALGEQHLDVALTLQNLGFLYQRAGHSEPAAEYFRRALLVRRELLPPDSLELAESLDGLASVIDDLGQLDESIQCHREALAIRENVLGPTHPLVSRSLNNFGVALLAQGNHDEAEVALRRAVAITPNDPGTRINLADVVGRVGNLVEAEAQLRAALQLQTESLHTSRHPETILTRKRLAQVLVQRGDRTVAKSLYSELLSDERARSGESHPAVAGILQALGEILYAEKDPDCESVFQRALEIREQTLGADAFDVTVTLTWLAEICLDRRDYVRGEQLYRRALTTRERTLGADSVALLVPKMKLALALCGLNRAAEARPFSEEALFGMMQNLPPEHPNYRFAVEIYSLVRARLGQ